MPRLNTSSQKLFATASVVVVFSVGLLTPSGWGVRVRGSQEDDEPKVESKVEAFHVGSMLHSGADYVLSLQNTSDKPINGYSIAVGAKSKLVVDLTIGDRVISPAEVVTVRIAASNLQTQGAAARRITILAALYEDGTGDGDPQAIAETRHRRIGVKSQLQRVLPLLQATLTQSHLDAPGALRSLKEQISSLPVEASGELPPRASAGLRSAKEDVLVALNQLDSSGGGFQEHLTRLKGAIERRLARLKAL